MLSPTRFPGFGRDPPIEATSDLATANGQLRMGIMDGVGIQGFGAIGEYQLVHTNKAFIAMGLRIGIHGWGVWGNE